MPWFRRSALLLCLFLVAACGDGADPLAGEVAQPDGPTAAANASPPADAPTRDPNSPESPTARSPVTASPSPAAADRPPPTSAPCDDPLGCYGEPRRVGTFDIDAVPQASGLAASRAHEDLLYLLDDRPGADRIHAVRRDGSTVATLTIAGMATLDGESLAVGPCGPDRAEPWCLFVGDVGDNLRSRGDVVVHRVPEPDLAGGPPAAALAGDVARLRYPDGAHDAEALLVDDDGRVHLVTKAPFDRRSGVTGETRLYRAEGFADGVLTDLGPLPVPPPAAPAQSLLVGAVVTGGDHQDGRVLLRTYDSVVEYVAPPGERDLATLARWPVREVPSPFEPQSEALTFAADGCGYLTVGELVGDIWHVPRRR